MTQDHIQIFEDSDQTQEHERAKVEVGARVVHAEVDFAGTDLARYLGFVEKNTLEGPLSQEDMEILVNSNIDKEHWADITGLAEKDIEDSE